MRRIGATDTLKAAIRVYTIYRKRRRVARCIDLFIPTGYSKQKELDKFFYCSKFTCIKTIIRREPNV